ncbi:alpha-hydroxy-acid oxidizing protein (plasmid) [Paroceanicella profunda]|uniref:Alpha-hydroxy-acid oxidizing protein n=1 Tax=Paroceanicella profunda TaxID=2579971 RepID=A0A5B8FJ69_9RHOB|nr:alpha-hydroxy acid oxidase [Paroceanicella profunda]QDL94581.1 alpha-hydroxy-acid oxidizing protein [Paroceanicella profunda]
MSLFTRRAPESAEAYRAAARARMPRFAFDFIDGGAGTEAGLARNRAAFTEALLMPRALVNTEAPISTARSFLGREWRLPFGIPPIGLAGIAWPGVDRILAAAAERHGVPYVASTPSTDTLEALKQVAPGSGMFQLYVGRSAEITDDLVARAEAAGYTDLVVTVDVPRPGKRLRDLRNGFGLPLRPGPRMVLDLLTHPAWSLAMARAGAPRFANLERYAAPGANARSLAELMAGQSSGRLDWALLARLRQRWSGRMVVKGILNPEDAARAVGEGADAVVVSNHGGRQLDSAPAPLTAIRAVRDRVGTQVPLALDGGVRSGEDILKALNAGADFVFLGRPFLFAVAARGAEGAEALFALLAAELESALAQTGLTALPGHD